MSARISHKRDLGVAALIAHNLYRGRTFNTDDEVYSTLAEHGFVWDERRGLWMKAERAQSKRPSARNWWTR